MSRGKRRSYRFAVFLLVLVAGLGYSGWRTFQWVQGKRLGIPMLAAVKARDSAKVIALLDRGAEPNTRDVPNPPLDLVTLIKSILRPDPKLTSAAWPTALQLAVETADAENRSDGSPDDAAALTKRQRESLEIVRALLQHGADPRAKRPDGNSILADLLNPASGYDEHRDTKVFALLLDYGADPNAVFKGVEDRYGQQTKPYEKPLLLLAYEWQKDDWHGRTRGEYLRLLLDHRANPNISDENGQSLLKMALDDDRTDLVRHMLEAGADPNRKSDGRSPLIDAVQWRNAEAVRLLLAKRADTNQVDLLGTSPLMIAAFNGDEDIVRALLAAGARADLADSEGKTARQFGADSPAIVALLDAAKRP